MLRCPAFIPPCAPSPRDRLPKGEGWLYEVKFDGYRMQVHKAGERIILYTRNGADWTDRFARLAEDLAFLPCTSAIIDAELVHMDGFEALHRCAHKRAKDGLMLWAFDLMQLDGNDLRAVALADRKRRLGHLIGRAGWRWRRGGFRSQVRPTVVRQHNRLGQRRELADLLNVDLSAAEHRCKATH